MFGFASGSLVKLLDTMADQIWAHHDRFKAWCTDLDNRLAETQGRVGDLERRLRKVEQEGTDE